MSEKLYWIIWLILVILWNYGFPEATPFQDVIVAVILSLLFIIIKIMQSRYLHTTKSRSKIRLDGGSFNMGIHYDYKSTRSDKAMKKKLREKLVLRKEELKDLIAIRN